MLREEGLHRMPDDLVFAKAVVEERIVLTFDLDFGDLAARVILFRLRNARRAHVVERLSAVLSASAAALERPVVVIVEDTRHRIRHLPIGGG